MTSITQFVFEHDGKIRVGDKQVSVETHQKRLAHQEQASILEVCQHPDRLGVEAKKLVCRRIVAATRQGLYEPSYYCQQSKSCPTCNAIRHRSRFSAFVDGLDMSAPQYLLNFVFTLPNPSTSAELRTYAMLAVDALESFPPTIGEWNRTNKSSQLQVHDYVSGLHLAARQDTPLFWPHLHMAMIVGKDVKVEGKWNHAILPWLKRMFEYTVDLPSTTIIKASKRRLVTTISKPHLQKLFAYICRVGKASDTPQTIADRSALLASIGNPPTFKRSRNRDSTSKYKTPSSPSTFDPGKLGKTSVYCFPINDAQPVEIHPSEFAATIKTLFNDAKQMLQSRIASP